MKSLGVVAPALFVLDKVDRNLVVAARNIPDVEVVRASDVNVFQLLRYPMVVVSRAGGFGVLGATGHSPTSLRQELRWIEDHCDGKPFGIEILTPHAFLGRVASLF